ncbi:MULTISPECIES: mycofactocin-associated electron transfer flavoprotein beta subunit [unclassified Pseudofrankia]|uniref:mycofactocin-associated electron transfer flavoprotein beta subunit n=1 Tax=unclassified Pseudofrankia TaxID=2994372 RepID=UPI0008D919B9|nr:MULTISPECIES: mycofactocin-associated electron transfer flavoprotein beta subunit [unclassified Pseudofrankia]MDT3442348.1 mycofactocin-associated electron transfer flavoprotein beta subunit [Pseudofrankia sp. BMG5.37]OHV47959.1 electron transfer flavoprotein subunit alpha [Pseudofrankia sp. BMG5.36]
MTNATGDGARGGGPLVVVCLRVTDLRPEVDPLTGVVTRSAHGAGLSAADEAALERALAIARAWSGRVLAVAAGSPIVEGPLRAAAALGAAVLRVAWPPHDEADGHGAAPGAASAVNAASAVDPEPFGPRAAYLADLAGDTRALAEVLVDAIRTVGEPTLVLCGDLSPDRGTGALPAQLAHALGAAQALGLVSLTPTDDGWLLAERRLDGGRRERLRVPTPAVCSAEAAGLRLRRAALPALLAAGDAPVPAARPTRPAVGAVEVVDVRAYRPRARVVPPPAGATPRDRLLALTGALVAHDPPTIIGPTDAGQAADALVAYLVRNGYLTA